MDIYLNFINRSNDTNNSEIVIFQKNVTTGSIELAVAWKVIKNCGQGDNHPFIYPEESAVSANDSYGNQTPQLPATNGQLFQMALTVSGDTLTYAGPASSAREIQVQNDLASGAINAGIYKDGRLLVANSVVAPGEMAVFEFKPTIWIGAVSQAEEGQVMNSAIVSNVNTELSLLGISSADIVMTGGGPGPSSTAFQFALENIVRA